MHADLTTQSGAKMTIQIVGAHRVAPTKCQSEKSRTLKNSDRKNLNTQNVDGQRGSILQNAYDRKRRLFKQKITGPKNPTFMNLNMFN